MYQEQLSQAQDFLKSVQMGMEVYDLDQNRVGQVADIRFPVDTMEDAMPEPENDLAGLHEVVRARLLRSGFIKIDTGFLRPDRYAMADQIIYVDQHAVYLEVRKDNLIRA